MPEKPMTILIVDDEKANINVLIELLKHKYRTIVAKDGEKALNLAALENPDLILLDIMMPAMDGYEVCRRLKAGEQTRAIPVIFVTAMSEAMDEAKSFELGAVDYITKPFVPVVVKARVELHLALKVYRTHLEAMVAERTKELEIAKIAAQSANKAKSDFLMNMGHELRTPLNGIMTAAELMLDSEKSEEREEICRIIRSSGELLLKTVENILEFTRSKDGELVLEHLPFRLDEALSKLSTRFFYKGAHIRLSPVFQFSTDHIPNALIGDKARLRDVIHHLFENAAKFTSDQKSALFSVDVSSACEKKAQLHFSLKDSGIGIAEENFIKIFEPFCQVDTSSTRQYDGVGIGLSTSKQIIELMGGKIWVESALGKGSTFHFTAQFDRQDGEIPFDAQIVHAGDDKDN